MREKDCVCVWSVFYWIKQICASIHLRADHANVCSCAERTEQGVYDIQQLHSASKRFSVSFFLLLFFSLGSFDIVHLSRFHLSKLSRASKKFAQKGRERGRINFFIGSLRLVSFLKSTSLSSFITSSCTEQHAISATPHSTAPACRLARLLSGCGQV